MTLRNSLLAQFVIFVAALAYTVAMITRLPDTIPIHWNINGEPDSFGSKWMNLLLGPALILFGMLLTVVLPKISPERYKIDRFAAAYGQIMVLISALFGFIHILVMQASAGHRLDMSRLMVAGICVFFALVGNLMGKVRQNFFVGIRTPWTLANEKVWELTHRSAARLWFFGGLAVALLTVLGAPIGLNFTLLMLIALWPVVDSYVIYRKLGEA